MITIFVQRDGKTEQAAKFDRAWLNPASGVHVWVDLAAPSIPEGADPQRHVRLPSAVGRGRDVGAPVPEGRGLRRLPLRHPARHPFPEGRQALRHPRRRFLRRPELPRHRPRRRLGDRFSELRDHATRNPKILGEGPVSLLHRIVDAMVDSYRPEIDKLEDRIDDLEKQIFDKPEPALVRRDSRREARRSPGCAGSSRRSATSSPVWRGATSSTSAPRCRSASATSTITSSASPTM